VSIEPDGKARVLVTLTTQCYSEKSGGGCFMGFDAAGGLTQSASDAFAVGSGQVGATTDQMIAASASYLVQVEGKTTFTAKYRRGSSKNGATFVSSRITVQLF
jgi:hypothetical protein